MVYLQFVKRKKNEKQHTISAFSSSTNLTRWSSIIFWVGVELTQECSHVPYRGSYFYHIPTSSACHGVDPTHTNWGPDWIWQHKVQHKVQMTYTLTYKYVVYLSALWYFGTWIVCLMYISKSDNCVSSQD